MKKAAMAGILFAATVANAAMCKMPTCKEPAQEKSQFCERHTCHTAGCNAGVKIGGLPTWTLGQMKRFAGNEGTLPTKLVWYHCPKHACGRFAPRLNNDRAYALFRNKDSEEALKLLACDKERLYKGKFCLEHSCAMSKCPGSVLEEWSETARDNASEPTMGDLTTHDFCQRHLSLKGNNKFEREGATKETCSEYYERKQAEKQKAAEAKKQQP